MEPMCDGVIFDETSVEGQPGIEEFITSDVVLGLLGIPEEGLIRISSALLIAGNNELCAYWWRDRYSGQQAVELRDPVHVRAAFSNTVIDSGYLPANVIRLGVGNGVKWMAVYVPPASYQLTLLDGEREQITIGLPGLIFTGRGNKYWMWATKDRQVGPHVQVYHVPLPNIGADGCLCFGTNSVPSVDGHTIMQAFHLFMDSPFSDHWATGKALSHPGDIRSLLTALSKDDPAVFASDDLVPIVPSNAPDRQLTLDDLLRHVLKGR